MSTLERFAGFSIGALVAIMPLELVLIGFALAHVVGGVR